MFYTTSWKQFEKNNNEIMIMIIWKTLCRSSVEIVLSRILRNTGMQSVAWEKSIITIKLFTFQKYLDL